MIKLGRRNGLLPAHSSIETFYCQELIPGLTDEEAPSIRRRLLDWLNMVSSASLVERTTRKTGSLL